MAQQKLVIDQATAPEATEKKKRKAPLILAGLGVIALVPIIGSTFAASISLGSGDVEFGQGTRAVAACDSDGMDVKLASEVVSGDFKLKTITFSGIADACKGKTFDVYVAGASSALLPWIASGTTKGTYLLPSTNGSVTSPTSGSTAETSGSTANANTFTITITTPYQASSGVEKVLVESSIEDLRRAIIRS